MHDYCNHIHKLWHKIFKAIIQMELSCAKEEIRPSNYGRIKCLKIIVFNDIEK